MQGVCRSLFHIRTAIDLLLQIIFGHLAGSPALVIRGSVCIAVEQVCFAPCVYGAQFGQRTQPVKKFIRLLHHSGIGPFSKKDFVHRRENGILSPLRAIFVFRPAML